MKRLLFGSLISVSLILPAASVQATTISLGLTAAGITELTGEAASDQAGYSVTSAGDVNNDGYDDVLIGAYRNNDAGSVAGAAYLIYGQASGITTASLSTAVQFTGEAAGDLAGASVASAEDVNNDGYDDILISSPTNTDGGSNAGAAYLIYGQSSHLASASLSTAIEFTGQAGDNIQSVASAGDVNNDGYDEILIGAQNNDAGAVNSGVAYLIYGQSAALSSSSLSTAIQFTGEAVSDFAGYSVASAGDVNNDGYDDLLVGAYDNDDGGNSGGSAYLIYGQSSLLSSASLSTAVQFTAESAFNDVGFSVASAGDVNNDGYDDILIGDEFNDDGSNNAGAAYLIYGQSSHLASASLSTAIEFTGESNGDEASYSVASAGDVNNDGYDDLLISAPNNDDGANNAGAVYLIYGQSTILTSVSLSTAIEFTGEVANDLAGGAVASAGDINNDGYDDIIIGSYNNDDAANNAGAAYVITPTASTITVTNNTSTVNTVECATGTFTDPGATSTDQFTSSALTVSTTDTVSNTSLGNQAVAYSNDNALHIAGAATRTVAVTDTIAPTITVTGEAALSITQGNNYTDAGAAVTDACDKGVSVTTSNPMDSTTPGTYTITYSATDGSGNTGTATRTVTVAAIDTVTQDDDGNLIITDEAGNTTTFDPFPGDHYVYTVMSDQMRVVATNGKLVRIFLTGERIDQKKINRKKLRARFIKLKVHKLYRSADYSDIMVLLAKPHQGKVNHLRLNTANQLVKFHHKQVRITKRRPSKIILKIRKHKFISRFGRGSNKVQSVWKVTRHGLLKSV